MLSFIKRHGTTMLVAMVTAAVTASAPVIAATVTNADKVDGFDAVGCKAKPDVRGGKLVAVCPNGYLPSDLLKKAADADLLDGLDASAFYRSGQMVQDSAKLSGYMPSWLVRTGYAVSPSSTTRVGKNGRVLSTTVTVPTSGILLIHASSDTYNPKARDLLACYVSLDGHEVPASRRWFVVNGVNSDDDCSTDAVVPVTKLGDVTVSLDAVAVDSKKTAFGRTVIWALFEPFDGTGAAPK
jgi:hypothetical protein